MKFVWISKQIIEFSKMNLTKITTDFILNKHPEFKNLPNEVLLMLAKKSAERKRDVSLVFCQDEQFCILRRWNVTESEIPYKIMKDSTLGFGDSEPSDSQHIFHLLLLHNQDILENHPIFEDVLSLIVDEDREDDYLSHDIKPELIQYLYTKILTPQRLLNDLMKIDFHICFEDETTWKCALRTKMVSRFSPMGTLNILKNENYSS